CPKGCEIELYGDASNPVFRGYSCERGLEFAKGDIVNPKRVLCTTVLTSSSRLLPVRTDREIPLESFQKVMQAVKQLVVERPVRRGEVIVRNIENTNANLISSTTSYNLAGGRTNVEARLKR
ncbi:MAG TPA: hypothetical protein DEA64_04080, partial [Pseudothermotoga sp.]|nr:hypothetical protein [Pseudothermotoga sp.]